VLRIFTVLAIFVTLSSCAFAYDTYVNGYVRSNGTYVEGYHRTSPDNTINNNYGTYPNVNPYTGKQGTIQPTYGQPYANPNPYNNGYGH
jgi:hypothetical protein